MGAKSSATLVRTPDISIVIDPGIAIMHPSYPATLNQKNEWLVKGSKIIKDACRTADVLIISHYHLDHYFSDDINIYMNKTIFAKNPNCYINDMQRTRCKKFYNSIIKNFEIGKDELIITKHKNAYPDPLLDLPFAMSKDFGSYNKRRKEVLYKGRKRFEKRLHNWNKYDYIHEIKSKKIEIKFPEEKAFKYGNTTIRFSKPLFHGIEYANVGWVFASIIEYKGKKLLHSSDLNGPIIEDYAEWIIKEDPTILILDGPTTYLFGYILNRINLNRAIENAVKIIYKLNSEVIIYDHHLTREKKFRDRTRDIWYNASKLNKKIITGAEYLGEQVFIENI
jgi:predicted metallo-beta-lactamase superfamily hydrolase